MDTIEPADADIGVAVGPRLRAIADQLRRLAPSRTDPHAYFQTKSDLVDELRRLAPRPRPGRAKGFELPGPQ
jgi:hypothetical protein